MENILAQQNEQMTTKEALEYFDSLEPASLEMMIGKWKGEGIDTNHPMNDLLKVSGWHGKIFEDMNNVHPLVHKGLFGGKYCINPALLPMKLAIKLPFLSILTPLFLVIFKPLISTKKPKAQLRMTEFRSKISATMLYDAKPINDVFRKIDENTLLGLMDHKGDETPFFFKLTKET